MSGSDIDARIEPLDVAVVDQDVLWRVATMNGVRPLYADVFADVASVHRRVHGDDATVVVVGPDRHDHTLAEVAELRALRPNVSVLAVAGADIAESGAEGIDVVFAADIADADLVSSVVTYVHDRRARATELAAMEESALGEADAGDTDDDDTRQEHDGVLDARLVLVTSAKGGVGRSTVALNLAAALAQQGVGERVALIETDAVYGDLQSLVGIAGPGRWSELSSATLTEEMVREHCTFTVGREPFDMVIPPQPADPWSTLERSELTALVAAVVTEHDWIVVEISPHLLDHSRIADLADLIYVVAPTDPIGLKNATILTGALHLQLADRTPLEFVLVDRDDNGRLSRAVTETAGVRVAGSIPHDRRVRGASEDREPLIDLHPHLGAGRALRALGEHTFTRLGAVTRSAP